MRETTGEDARQRVTDCRWHAAVGRKPLTVDAVGGRPLAAADSTCSRCGHLQRC
jgi:hypothetical protein